jgi:hypothetical protein
MVDKIEISEGQTGAEAPKEDVKPVLKEEPKGERPEWLPGKFQSPEEMAKAYGELETKLSKSS